MGYVRESKGKILVYASAVQVQLKDPATLLKNGRIQSSPKKQDFGVGGKTWRLWNTERKGRIGIVTRPSSHTDRN